MDVKKLRMRVFVLLAAALALCSRPAYAQAGAVYTLTNPSGANTVMVFDRTSNGHISPVGTFATGGTGTGSGLGSQGYQSTRASGETSPEMLGRVSSSFMSVFALAQVLGLLLSGHLTVWFGIRAVFLQCAAALGLIAMLGLKQHKPPEVSLGTSVLTLRSTGQSAPRANRT